MNPCSAAAFTLQPASADDFEPLHALRLRAMHCSLAQLGRYDEPRARERLAAGFVPAHTQHIVADGQRVGFLVLKQLSHALRLDHFYIDPPAQRRGIGSAVMAQICEQADALQLPVELCALKGSAANRFYLHHGFAMTGDGDWDHDYLRMPASPSLRAVRALWAAAQRGDWTAARALLHAKVELARWSRGERCLGAEAFIAALVQDSAGRTLRLIELVQLQDGRVLALLRLDAAQEPTFVTSLFRVDDGLITGLEQFHAAFEPTACMLQPGLTQHGWEPLDPLADPRARQP